MAISTPMLVTFLCLYLWHDIDWVYRLAINEKL